jgi:hypothetical protein
MLMSTTHHAASAAPGSLTRLTLWATLAALLGASWSTLRDTHQRRLSSRPALKPEKLQVWEDEGGQNQMPGHPR